MHRIRLGEEGQRSDSQTAGTATSVPSSMNGARMSNYLLSIVMNDTAQGQDAWKEMFLMTRTDWKAAMAL